MDVKEIITHLSNFQNTWKGWNGLISGITGFFGQNPVGKLDGLFGNEAAGLKAAFAPLSSNNN